MRWTSVTLLLAGLLALQTGSVAAAPAQNDPGLVARVLELTNSERQKAGLNPLTLNSELSDAAQTYSQVLATSGCFQHTCGSVPNFAERVGQSGYSGWTALAENIAAGYATPEAVVAGWMSSPGHRANILSPKYTEMGIGLVSGGGQFGAYWTQEFGSRPGMVVNQALQADLRATDDSAVGASADGGGSGA
jgi:uncharacterized protein YkwD